MTGFGLTDVRECKGIREIFLLESGILGFGIWNKGQAFWIPLITGIQNLSSTDKESRMQYPWCGIENPRLSDSLAWADHCFQLDKIKDIMCFHYFIFATRKNSHKLQYTTMQVFHFWEKETAYFPNFSVFSCILLSMKWANNNELSLLWH